MLGLVFNSATAEFIACSRSRPCPAPTIPHRFAGSRRFGFIERLAYGLLTVRSAALVGAMLNVYTFELGITVVVDSVP